MTDKVCLSANLTIGSHHVTCDFLSPWFFKPDNLNLKSFPSSRSNTVNYIIWAMISWTSDFSNQFWFRLETWKTGIPMSARNIVDSTMDARGLLARQQWGVSVRASRAGWFFSPLRNLPSRLRHSILSPPMRKKPLAPRVGGQGSLSLEPLRSNPHTWDRNWN